MASQGYPIPEEEVECRSLLGSSGEAGGPPGLSELGRPQRQQGARALEAGIAHRGCGLHALACSRPPLPDLGLQKVAEGQAPEYCRGLGTDGSVLGQSREGRRERVLHLV